MFKLFTNNRLCFLNIKRVVRKLYSTQLVGLSCAERVKYLREMALPKSRQNPIITKLETPEFKSVFTDELTSLVSLFKEYGYEIRIAGGAVRDLVMGMRPKDIDFATVATPEQMKEMFTTENIRMINMKGEKHGTITPRINDKENFEITTLRIDVVTDGRHAEVQFTTDWMLDALRRDLTINSMFLGLDGSLYDYFFGYEDVKNQRVAFVGDAATRIQEDYLRILRYFRFYGRIAKDPENHESETLQAIQNNVHGLKDISGERIWTELKKILECNFAGELLTIMLQIGIGPYIGLPKEVNTDEMNSVWSRSRHLQLNAITFLCSLLETQEQVLQLHGRLKLSAYERDMALFVVEHRAPKLHPKPLLPYQQLIANSKFNKSHVKEWALEALKYNNSPHVKELEEWEIPKFPVNGVSLKKAGVEVGKRMGLVLNELRGIWVASEFNAGEDELLRHVPRIVTVLDEKQRK